MDLVSNEVTYSSLLWQIIKNHVSKPIKLETLKLKNQKLKSEQGSNGIRCAK